MHHAIRQGSVNAMRVDGVMGRMTMSQHLAEDTLPASKLVGRGAFFSLTLSATCIVLMMSFMEDHGCEYERKPQGKGKEPDKAGKAQERSMACCFENFGCCNPGIVARQSFLVNTGL